MLQSCDLLKPSYVCVHFGPPHKVEVARQEMDGSSIRVIECDVSSVDADGALFDVISSVLAFPDYFGENWDALDECLRDLKAWLPAPGYVLIAHGATNLWRPQLTPLASS